MTAVCAVVHGGKVHMGGDSAGVSGYALDVRADPKVFVNGAMVMGFTSSFRMGQLLHWRLAAPHHPEGVDDARYMATDFVDAVRQCLKDGGIARKENDVESGGTFLVGYHGKIWTVYDDYQVATQLQDFDAVGGGTDLCRGSLHSTAALDIEPRLRLAVALEAAQAFNAGVRAPFTFAREP